MDKESELIDEEREENAIDQRWLRELENASAKFHISKLNAELLEIRAEYEKAFAKENEVVEDTIKESYTDRYDHMAFEIQKGYGVGFKVAGVDSEKLDKVIKKPWASDGKNFSDRIWTKKEQMVDALHGELIRSMLTGGNTKDAIKIMQRYVSNDVKNAKYAAARLIRTESSYFASEGQKECFKDLDVEKYEIVATLDNRTSDICQGMDGQVFDMKDFETGVTAPPFHVNCRSTTAPYFDDEFAKGERAARDTDGKTFYVPSDMTYKEWKNGDYQIEENEIGYKMRGNWPKGFVDKREIGNKISQEDLDDFIDYAKSKNIQIGTIDNKTGGFSEYCGDVKVLYEYVDKLSDYKIDKVILKYDNVLGFSRDGKHIDNSIIDIDAFAETKGNTITLNKFMYDATGFMKNAYLDSVKKSKFVKGSTYLNVIDHEVMHLKSKRKEAKRIVKKFIENNDKKGYNIKKRIKRKVSKYAAITNLKNEFVELASELNVIKAININKYNELLEG